MECGFRNARQNLGCEVTSTQNTQHLTHSAKTNECKKYTYSGDYSYICSVTHFVSWPVSYSNHTRSPSVRLCVRYTRISSKLSGIDLWLLLNANRKSGFLIQNLPWDWRPEVRFRHFGHLSAAVQLSFHPIWDDTSSVYPPKTNITDNDILTTRCSSNVITCALAMLGTDIVFGGVSLSLSVCVYVCLAFRTKSRKLPVRNWCNLVEYVLWQMLEVIESWWHLSLTFDLESYFRIFVIQAIIFE